MSHKTRLSGILSKVFENVLFPKADRVSKTQIVRLVGQIRFLSFVLQVGFVDENHVLLNFRNRRATAKDASNGTGKICAAENVSCGA